MKGKVIAITKAGYVIHDGTGGIYVYTGSTPSVSIGDALTVSGTPTNRYGSLQFASSSASISTYTGEDEISIPEATALTAEKVAAWASADIENSSTTKFISPTEVKLYSWTATAGKSGNYTTLNIDGCDTLIEPSSMPSAFSFTEGTSYDITAVFGSYNNSAKYVGMYIVSATPSSTAA